jgi:LysR family glycine cleavage system transcriptional activator
MTEAARRLSISPGAVSQQMKILEEALGLTLVVRQGASLELTPAGKHFYESCTGAFETLRVAQDEIKRVKDENSLSISALPSLMTKWLSPLVFLWQKEHPGLNVYLDGAYPEPVPSMYDIDFRITYGDMIAEGDNAVLLYSDCVVPACSPSLLKGKKAVRKPADLLLYSLLSVDWVPKFALPPSWSDWFAANGVDASAINERYRVFSLSSMAIESAVLGHGFVLAQYSMIRRELAAGELITPIHAALPISSPYYLKWKKNAFDKEQCKQFHRWLIAKGKEQTNMTERLLLEKHV